jgi:hypothetical protein
MSKVDCRDIQQQINKKYFFRKLNPASLFVLLCGEKAQQYTIPTSAT